MPAFSVDVPHPLSQEQAIERLKSVLDQLGKEQSTFSLEKTVWTGNSLAFAVKAVGMTIDGTMIVYDSRINIEGDIPFAASIFKGRIEQELKDRVARLMNKDS